MRQTIMALQSSVCDLEGKGFITKRDLHRLGGGALAGLAPEHLDEVFDFLDRDHNGYLTMEELRLGFGEFLGFGNDEAIIQVAPDVKNGLKDDITSKKDDGAEDEEEEEEEEEANFQALMDNLGARGLFQSEDYVRSLWSRIRKDDSTQLHHFESFLQKVVKEMRKVENEYSNLENAFKNRSILHDNEVRKLSEEMEQLIKTDKEKIQAQGQLRERRMREEFEEELRLKDKNLQDLFEKLEKMEKQLKSLNVTESETKVENSRLQEERDILEQKLEIQERRLQDAQRSADTIRHRELGSRRERARAALRVSEGIALEREGLVKQLDILRDVNRKLVDEKDCEVNPQYSNEESLSAELRGHCMNGNNEDSTSDLPLEEQKPHRSRFAKRSGSIMSTYLNCDNINTKAMSSCSTDECEVDDGFFALPPCSSSLSSELQETSCSEYEESALKTKPQFRTRRLANLNNLRCSTQRVEQLSAHEKHFSHGQENNQHDMKGEWKVKRTICSDSDGDTQGSDPIISSPERLYKIVFIGDSGVGKSSFIHRFCNDSFRTNFSATIGVDFQVRSVTVDGHVIALQLWDTAGQERFRSITKQYYRKADGVIIMFDVLSEISFQNVRNWMTDVKSGADENTVLLLVGNKIDQCLEESKRVIRYTDGQRQAEDYGSLYHETSAKTGEGVEEAILAMAALLQQREDEVMERAFKLREQKKKKKCC